MALTDDIVAYYQLEESSGDAIDQVGTQDGTVVGCDYEQTGKIDYCYGFVRANEDYVDITGVTTADDTLSVSLWMKTTFDGSPWEPYMFSADGDIFIIAYPNASNYVAFYDGSWRTSSGPDVADGDWHHVVVILNSTAGDIYVDNDHVYDSTCNTTNISGNVKMGAWNYFDGYIDEVGIWDRALTEAEVGELWNSGDGLTYPFAAAGTNSQINIGDVWKEVPAMQINIGDVWKEVASASINIGDTWKTIY